MKTDFVTVQYEDRFRPGTYGGREYSYIADHRLKVGDVVYVETKLGAGQSWGQAWRVWRASMLQRPRSRKRCGRF